MTPAGFALFGFDHSTVMAEPWAHAGYICYCVDIQHESGEHRDGNIIRVGCDIRRWRPLTYLPWKIAAFFPPCTHLAVSGARWFRGKGLRALSQSIELVAEAAEMAETLACPYLIEQPVSTLASYWRPPDYTFDPCDYGGYLDPPGDEYTKKTCLWTGGGFVMPEKKRVSPTQGSKMHLLPPSEERANLRSVTPRGFAQAVFEANQMAFVTDK